MASLTDSVAPSTGLTGSLTGLTSPMAPSTESRIGLVASPIGAAPGSAAHRIRRLADHFTDRGNQRIRRIFQRFGDLGGLLHRTSPQWPR
jgi:hypothetical protein